MHRCEAPGLCAQYPSAVMAIYKLTLILAAAARGSAFGTLPLGASPSESIDVRSAAAPWYLKEYPIQYVQG